MIFFMKCEHDTMSLTVFHGISKKRWDGRHYNAKISKLKQMKTFNRSPLESIYFKGILPSATYCISQWGTGWLTSRTRTSVLPD